MKKIYNLTFLVLFFVFSLSYSQNELYINGADVYVNGRISTSIPTLRVNGEIKNIDGNFNNAAGLIEITGNWTNTISSTKNYTSTGIERFLGTDGHVISGKWNDTLGNTNQFFDLEIVKSSTTGEVLSLASNINVNASGSLKFTSTNGIIRTDVSSHADDGSAYVNELFLQNPTNANFSGYSTGNGATTKYIEGKLRRQINNTGVHYFPVGVAPTSLDGMESFELNFTTNPNNSIVGFIKPATTAPIYRNIVCDIGKDPSSTVSNPFTDCVGGPDGIIDLYVLESSNDLSHEWSVTPRGSTIGYSYGITMHPGVILDPDTYYTIPSACSTPYQNNRLRIVAKNGKPGGDVSSGPFTPFPFAHLTCYGYCGIDNSDLDISLNGQTSFSTFRIHGTLNPNSTALPVELVSFTAMPVDNQYIQLDWVTASETNNYGFEIQRSADGINYSSLGFVAGHGNKNTTSTYQYQDKDVVSGILYYYKLKQIDFNQAYKFSNIEKAKINGVSQFSISNLYPNPSNADAYIDIFAPSASNINIEIYNALGQNIKNKTINLIEGINKINLQSSDLSSGTYIVKLNHNFEMYTKKLVKK
jgi:hypothetical protein